MPSRVGLVSSSSHAYRCRRAIRRQVLPAMYVYGLLQCFPARSACRARMRCQIGACFESRAVSPVHQIGGRELAH